MVPNMTWSTLSSLLWRERELLELLLFKLEEEQLLLAAGRGRWLARATREVELVLEEIRSAELVRSMTLEALAREAGLEPNPSLARLAESAAPPWPGILAEHRAAFLELTQQISALAQTNRELLATGYRAVKDTLAGLTGPEPETHTAVGRTSGGHRGGRLLDGAP
jgi:hypothetical protein